MITINLTKKTALLAGGLFLSVLSINADGNITGLTPEMLRPQFSNLTPEAASLGRYGAFQVSEYSGAANISIPLYTVKSGDVSFPITLYYDATGIKVEQDATFVGLGWNLSYGGMISHIVCGEDDFCEIPGFDDFNQKYWGKKKASSNDLPFVWEPRISVPGGLGEGNTIYGDFMYKTPIYKKDKTPWYYSLIPGAPDSSYSLEGYLPTGLGESDCEERLNLYDRMSRGYDSPDVYQASFCGHNISFVIDKRAGVGTDGYYPVVVLNNNLRKYKISYTIGENMSAGYGGKNVSSFTITDDKGISYCFSAAYIENSIGPAVYLSSIDSYYLTKIYGPDGEKGKSVVNFEYEQDTIYIGRSRTPSKKHQTNARLIGNANDADPNIPNQNLSLKYQNIYKRLVGINKDSYPREIACGSQGEMYRVYPKRIVTDLETIEFKMSEKEERLDLTNGYYISGLTIKRNTGGSSRNISFAYDYFKEDTSSGRRLKLTGINIDDQAYKFEYDNQNLPSFASYSKDYWGYYNGANPYDDKFIGCTPRYEISNGTVKEVEHLKGSNRLASEELCKVGMLKKVIYPTGGYTLYEFEANRFNDRYYYPDASHKITCSATNKIIESGLSGTQMASTKITTSLGLIKLIFDGLLDSSSDYFIVTIKDSSGSQKWGKKYENKHIRETVSLTLNKGETYTIEAKLNAASSSGIIYKYIDENTIATASPTTKDENGGYSIGGGVRIRTIKNYDSDNKYLNGVKYEYSGGKLLSPTVQLEKHLVDFKFGCKDENGVPYSNIPVNFSFYYANTEPTYLHICSLGIPATVGYDCVVKKEIDRNEEILRKTILFFHNHGYITDDNNMNSVNSLVNNAFYFNSYNGNNPAMPQGHLNGKLKEECILNIKGDTVMKSHYEYLNKIQGNILYPKCVPLHFKGFLTNSSNYDLAFYVKFITWSYLTSKTETLYDNNGKQTTSNTTLYEYNSSNYQLSQQTVSNGVDSVRTNYWYPTDKKVLTDKKVKGYEFLNEIHNISEVTAIDTYRNGTFTGGSQFDFRKWTKTKLPVPVVDKCYSITPFKDKILEMKVDETYGYDNYGNIRQYNKKDGTPVTIIWSYNHQLPIMEIVGKTYSQVKAIYAKVADLEKDDISATDITTKTNELHKALKAEGTFATAYMYSPWHTVSEIIKPNGDRLKYSYDKYGRLEKTSDVNNKILQKYSYNYKKEK